MPYRTKQSEKLPPSQGVRHPLSEPVRECTESPAGVETDGLSDARLIERVRAGNSDAFAGLVERYERKLLRVIRRMINDPELARDMAQETFLRTYQNLHRFDTGRRFGPWLFRVGVNLCVDQLRHRDVAAARFSEAPNGEDGWAFDVPDADPRASRELSQEVHHVLDQVPLKYRTILVLRDLEGFSCSEVAAIVNRREPTVRWRLAKARSLFRRLWERREQSGGRSR